MHSFFSFINEISALHSTNTAEHPLLEFHLNPYGHAQPNTLNSLVVLTWQSQTPVEIQISASLHLKIDGEKHTSVMTGLI